MTNEVMTNDVTILNYINDRYTETKSYITMNDNYGNSLTAPLFQEATTFTTELLCHPPAFHINYDVIVVNIHR